MTSDLAWSSWADGAERRLYVPDVRLAVVPDGAELVPLRGYSVVLAVVVAGRCVGWRHVEDEGVADVKAWIAQHNWKAPARPET